MKLKMLFIVLIAVATTISVNAKPLTRTTDAPDEPVRFDRLNVVMKAISDMAVLGDERVEWVYPYFDPSRSSIEAEKLYYSMKGSATNTPWVQQGRVTAEMETSYEVDRTAMIPGIAVKLHAQTNLDFLSFARYSATQALNRIKFYDDVDEGRAKELLEKTKNVQSLAEFKSILEEGQKLGLDSLRKTIKRYLDKIDCYERYECGNVTVDQWGNRVVDYQGLEWVRSDLEAIRRFYDVFEQNKISFNGLSITITNPYPGGVNGSNSDGRETRVKKWGYTFTNTAIALNSEIFAEVKVSDLDKMKADIHKSLKKLEIDQDDAQGKTQRDFKEALQKMREWINKAS